MIVAGGWIPFFQKNFFQKMIFLEHDSEVWKVLMMSFSFEYLDAIESISVFLGSFSIYKVGCNEINAKISHENGSY